MHPLTPALQGFAGNKASCRGLLCQLSCGSRTAVHAHLRPDDGAPLVLLRLLHHELGALRLLRGHLLGLDGRRELAAEGEGGGGGEAGGREGGRRENSRERGSRIKRKGSPEMGREKGSAFSNTAQCRS